MTSQESAANAEMIAYWNESGGERFVQFQQRLDVQIGPFGRVAIERGNIVAGERVLDVGCGCGDTTLQIAERVGAEGRVTGVDVSGPMLAVAKRRAQQANVDNVDFECRDAQTAQLPENAFDCVYSRFGVMFFDDPVAAFRNLRVALVPGGRLAFACWQPLPKNPWMLLPAAAAAKVIPMPAPPEPGAPGPFAFGDDARVREILERAGFDGISIEPYESTMLLGGSDNIDEAVELILEIGPISRALSEADPALRPVVARAVREAIVPHATPRGVELGAAVWFVTAQRS
jgi:SAM-dependent methyltransferase